MHNKTTPAVLPIGAITMPAGRVFQTQQQSTKQEQTRKELSSEQLYE